MNEYTDDDRIRITQHSKLPQLTVDASIPSYDAFKKAWEGILSTGDTSLIRDWDEYYLDKYPEWRNKYRNDAAATRGAKYVQERDKVAPYLMPLVIAPAAAAIGLGTAGATASELSSAAGNYLMNTAAGKFIAPYLPNIGRGVSTLFGINSAHNLASKDGVRKTYDLFRLGWNANGPVGKFKYYDKASKSLVGDMLDASVVGMGAKDATGLARSIYDATKTQRFSRALNKIIDNTKIHWYPENTLPQADPNKFYHTSYRYINGKNGPDIYKFDNGLLYTLDTKTGVVGIKKGNYTPIIHDRYYNNNIGWIKGDHHGGNTVIETDASDLMESAEKAYLEGRMPAKQSTPSENEFISGNIPISRTKRYDYNPITEVYETSIPYLAPNTGDLANPSVLLLPFKSRKPEIKFTIELLPGYLIKSLLTGNPLEKQIAKNGNVNIKQIRGVINNSDTPAIDKYILEKVLEKHPNEKFIDFNLLRREAQEFIPLYSRVSKEKYKTYGADRLGLFNRDDITKAKYNTFTFESPGIFGNTKHYRGEPLGHSRTYTTKEEPEVLHVMESLSDWALNYNKIKDTPINNHLAESHLRRLMQENMRYAAMNGLTKMRYPTPETAAKIEGYPKQTLYRKEGEKELFYELDLMGKYPPGEYPGIPSEYKEVLTYEPKAYEPKYLTILKKYEDFSKLFKKTFGKKPTVVTDAKGNTWYEVDIPEDMLQRELIFKNGGQLNMIMRNIPIGLLKIS